MVETIDPFSSEGQLQIAEMARTQFDHLHSVLTTLDNSRARALALTHLETAMLWFEYDQTLKKGEA